jgi:hypothetical protein
MQPISYDRHRFPPEVIRLHVELPRCKLESRTVRVTRAFRAETATTVSARLAKARV